MDSDNPEYNQLSRLAYLPKCLGPDSGPSITSFANVCDQNSPFEYEAEVYARWDIRAWLLVNSFSSGLENLLTALMSAALLPP